MTAITIPMTINVKGRATDSMIMIFFRDRLDVGAVGGFAVPSWLCRYEVSASVVDGDVDVDGVGVVVRILNSVAEVVGEGDVIVNVIVVEIVCAFLFPGNVNRRNSAPHLILTMLTLNP